MKRCKVENISEADDILTEAKYLRDLSHKYIVKYIDDFIHIEFNKGKIEPIYYVIIIMEFCEGGDLKKKIDDVFNAKGHFSKAELINILLQICESLNYLHNRNIIHRDIKSQNIFFTKDNIVRIGDFGLAKKIKKNRRTTYMTKVGTDSYMAPEVLKGESYGKPV
jgi:NIMA (never in mitosis gene a)-related kinase 1/4/5